MTFLRPRTRGQSVTEYMMMIAVVAIGLMIALEKFSDPNGPIQTAGNDLATDFESGLNNNGGGMKVQ